METRVLIDGHWVTRRVDLDDVLRYHEERDSAASTVEVPIEEPPVLGILTQTVVQSPLVHHILPIKMRGLEYNDVAFIGEDFVQIRELRSDGFLWDLVRKENLGARIRNARVVGSLDDYQRDLDAQRQRSLFKTEKEDVRMFAEIETKDPPSWSESMLPPQFLVLQLDTGDSIFLMMRTSNTGILELVISSRHRVTRPMLDTQPGMYLSVNPTSQYMAVACSETHCSVFELRSRDELQSQLSQGLQPQHVKCDAYIPFQGVVQNMEFLYPSLNMVVLLLLVISKGKTRMVIYEWVSGSDIRRITPLTKRGHLLGAEHQMPLLLIPLKFKSTFILVCETQMAVFENILEGAPDSRVFYDRVEPFTPHHHGLSPPLWVGWARPTNRTRAHTDHRDDVYIAREDGLLTFLEVDCDNFVESDMNVGEFEGRCGHALACIDYRNPDSVTGDMLITGGDSCAGGCYLVQARETPLLIQPIENWTPVQDFVAVPVPLSTTLGFVDLKNRRRRVPPPDRLFACVGKGSKGAITEFRYGLEARIGLQFDYESPIMQVWALPSEQVTHGNLDGTLLLLSMGASCVALRLSSDETSVEIIGPEILKLDLEQHTLAVTFTSDCVIQVTESSILLIESSRRYVILADQLLHVQHGTTSHGIGNVIHHAIVKDRLIMYTTSVDNKHYLLLLDLTAVSKLDVIQDGRMLWHVSAPSHITAIATCIIDQTRFVVTAEFDDDSNQVSITFNSADEVSKRNTFNVSTMVPHLGKIAAIGSIAILDEDEVALVLCGSTDGALFTLAIVKSTFQVQSCDLILFGTGPVAVQINHNSTGKPVIILNCDTKTFNFKPGPPRAGHLTSASISQIWFTDAAVPSLQQPGITSIAGFVPSFTAPSYDRLLVVAGTQLLLTSLDMVAKAVPRHLDIKGTPTRLLYSQRLHALVVATSIDNKTTILFIDPDTGEDLTYPLEKKGGEPAKYGAGLGKANERFFRLMEWKYEKDNHSWDFIIATTNSGRQLIFSAEAHPLETVQSTAASNTTRGTAMRKRKIAYYTRYKFKVMGPIYSITGFPHGLLWCTGEILYCDVLEDRKFRRVAEYELPSLARSLEYKDGRIYVLTQEHSLQILELVHTNDNFTIHYITSDKLSRVSLDHITIQCPPNYASHRRPLHLVSDKFRSFVGLWPTHKTIADTLETVFEGQIAESVLKFLPTMCRPVWDSTWNFHVRQQGKRARVGDERHQEIIGLSIRGALTLFTPVDYPTWEFLRFIINLCQRSKEVCDFSWHDGPVSVEVARDPKVMMHIDGDILRRCLDGRKLEAVLEMGDSDIDRARIFGKFQSLLRSLHGGVFDDDASPVVYLEQAYADLELYLRPVL